MPPAQRVGGRVRRGVGEQRQHEALGVPEGVPVVARARSGPSPGWRRRSARAPACSTWNRPKRTACCTHGVALDLDVGGVPEVVEVLALARQQAVPAGVAARRSSAPRPGRAAAGCERTARPAVGQELDDRAASRPARSMQTTVVRAQSARRVGLARRTRPGASTTWSMPAAMSRPLRAGAVQQQRAVLLDVVLHGHQRVVERRRDPRVAGSGGCASLATSSDCTMTRTARRRRPRPRSTMAATARCVNDTSRVERIRTRLPAGEVQSALRGQRAGPQVEHALVAMQLAVAHVERLVVDQQPDQLAVGDVDDRLARTRGSRSRPRRRAAGAARRTS